MYAVISLPNFRLQSAIRWRDDVKFKPVAIIDDTSAKSIVIEANRFALDQGLSIGMSTAQALSRCPEIILLPPCPKNESTIESVLLETAYSLTPDIELTGRGLCTLDMTRLKVEKWHSWCEQVNHKLGLLSIVGTIGVAAHADLALLAARKTNSYSIVEKAELFLDDLPISDICTSPELTQIFESWGIQNIGELKRLPQSGVTSRLGQEALQFWNAAHCKTVRLLKFVKPAENFIESFNFEDPVTLTEGIYFIIKRFLKQLCFRLENVNKAAQRVTLRLTLEDENSFEKVFSIPSPTRDQTVLFRILSTFINELKLEHAVIGLSMEIKAVAPDHSQFTLFDTVLRDPNRFHETLGRIIGLVGHENVGTAQKLQTYRSDNAIKMTPRFHKTIKATEESEWAVGLPLKRFRPPIPADIRFFKNLPVSVFSEAAKGRVIDCAGPYRKSGDWWNPRHWSVEEWDVELNGYGMFRISNIQNRWHVEGYYETELH